MKKSNFWKFFSVGAVAALGFMSCVSAETYSESFKKLTTDGNFYVNAVKDFDNHSNDTHGLSDWLYQKIFEIGLPENQSWDIDCSTNSDTCKVGIIEKDTVVEEHDVKVIYEESNSSAMTEVKEVIESLETPLTNYTEFVLQDLNLINYYASADSKNYYETLWAAYTEDMINLLKGKNISYRSGVAGSIADYAFESIFQSYVGYLYYGDLMYAITDGVSVNKRSLLYVPSDTENTKESIRKAAEDRIKAYLPNVKAEVSYGGAFVDGKVGGKTVYRADSANVFGNTTDYYNIKIGDTTYKFVILISDNEKEEPKIPNFEKVDASSGIKVESTDNNLPLNTIINAVAIKEDTTLFNKIADILNTKNFKAFDISLMSNDVVVSKFNGTYTVTVPLGKDYVGKDLKAYHIKDGKIAEDYDVTIDDSGNATFKTTHFSIYAIGEVVKSATDNKGEEDVPKTSDSIMTYVGLGLISLCVLGIALKSKIFN